MNRSTRTAGYAVTAVTILLALLAVRCRTPQPARLQFDPDARSAHAVRNQQIREVMHSLTRHVPQPLWPQEVEQDRRREWNAERERRFNEAWSFAEELSAAALTLPQLVEQQKLTEKEQAVFEFLAQKLGEESVDLARAARERDLKRMQVTMNQISATCNDCHNRFREQAGEIYIES